MKDIILYGSQYGSTYRYAQKLSEQTGIPAVSYKDAPALSDKKIIVYLGGLYAGGILGLMKTLRGFSLRDGQKLLIVTVGPVSYTHLDVYKRQALPFSEYRMERSLSSVA